MPAKRGVSLAILGPGLSDHVAAFKPSGEAALQTPCESPPVTNHLIRVRYWMAISRKGVFPWGGIMIFKSAC